MGAGIRVLEPGISGPEEEPVNLGNHADQGMPANLALNPFAVEKDPIPYTVSEEASAPLFYH
jgi:hypothetical protein